MACTNEKCEYNPTLNRQAQDRTQQEIRYGQLWIEMEPPKPLQRGERHE